MLCRLHRGDGVMKTDNIQFGMLRRFPSLLSKSTNIACARSSSNKTRVISETSPKTLADFINDSGESGCGSVKPRPVVETSNIEEPTPNLPTSSQARSFYRSILRAANGIPTAHRRNHIKKRARMDFEENCHVIDPERIE